MFIFVASEIAIKWKYLCRYWLDEEEEEEEVDDDEEPAVYYVFYFWEVIF